MYQAMTDYSQHPVQPLSELEVFIGYIINQRGVQSRRQRDRSEKLKDEFERISTLTVWRMRGNRKLTTAGHNKGLDALDLCLACVHTSLSRGAGLARPGKASRGHRGDELQSFRVVSACALLKEVESLERDIDG